MDFKKPASQKIYLCCFVNGMPHNVGVVNIEGQEWNEGPAFLSGLLEKLRKERKAAIAKLADTSGFDVEVVPITEERFLSTRATLQKIYGSTWGMELTDPNTKLYSCSKHDKSNTEISESKVNPSIERYVTETSPAVPFNIVAEEAKKTCYENLFDPILETDEAEKTNTDTNTDINESAEAEMVDNEPDIVECVLTATVKNIVPDDEVVLTENPSDSAEDNDVISVQPVDVCAPIESESAGGEADFFPEEFEDLFEVLSTDEENNQKICGLPEIKNFLTDEEKEISDDAAKEDKTANTEDHCEEKAVSNDVIVLIPHDIEPAAAAVNESEKTQGIPDNASVEETVEIENGTDILQAVTAVEDVNESKEVSLRDVLFPDMAIDNKKETEVAAEDEQEVCEESPAVETEAVDAIIETIDKTPIIPINGGETEKYVFDESNEPDESDDLIEENVETKPLIDDNLDVSLAPPAFATNYAE